MNTTRYLVVVIFLTQIWISEGFFLPTIGLVGLGVAGLAGLKIYYGMKLFGPSLMRSPDEPPVAPPPNHPIFSPLLRAIGVQKDNKVKLTTRTPWVPDGSKQYVVLPFPFNAKDGKVQAVPAVPSRSRRALPGGLKLNEDLFNYVDQWDDNGCAHRFFCDLGMKGRSAFGNIGRMANMIILMGALREEDWPLKMYRQGQVNNTCAGPCDEESLQATVKYFERHLFATPEDSDAEEAPELYFE